MLSSPWVTPWKISFSQSDTDTQFEKPNSTAKLVTKKRSPWFHSQCYAGKCVATDTLGEKPWLMCFPFQGCAHAHLGWFRAPLWRHWTGGPGEGCLAGLVKNKSALAHRCPFPVPLLRFLLAVCLVLTPTSLCRRFPWVFPGVGHFQAFTSCCSAVDDRISSHTSSVPMLSLPLPAKFYHDFV